jgi:hypothetical protein
MDDVTIVRVVSDGPIGLIENNDARESELWTAYLVALAREHECWVFYQEAWRQWVAEPASRLTVLDAQLAHARRLYDEWQAHARATFVVWQAVAYPMYGIPTNPR